MIGSAADSSMSRLDFLSICICVLAGRRYKHRRPSGSGRKGPGCLTIRKDGAGIETRTPDLSPWQRYSSFAFGATTVLDSVLPGLTWQRSEP